MAETKNANGESNGDGKATISRRDLMSVVNNALNAQFSRESFSRKAMDPRRSIDDECGYPGTEELSVEEYRDMYDREPVAARVVQLLPRECWQTSPEVFEDDDPETVTAFEESWDGLGAGLHKQSWFTSEDGSGVWEYLRRADELSGIGSYGLLMLGLDDGLALLEPAAGVIEKGSRPAQEDDKGKQEFPYGSFEDDPAVYNITADKKETKDRKLVYMRAFSEDLCSIEQVETNPTSPRFGMPTRYGVSLSDPRDMGLRAGASISVTSASVHWTRVIHVADNLGSSEVFGVPRQRPVWNRLLDIRKLYGSDAESFYRQVVQKIFFEMDPGLVQENLQFDMTEFRAMMEKMMNSLQQWAVLKGMSAKAISPQVVDLTSHINAQVEAICIQLACPKRIFSGSERGELSSSQDQSSWDKRLQSRRQLYLTPRVIVPFVDRCILTGLVAEPETYTVVWPDPAKMSETEEAALGLQRTTALKEYVAGGIEAMMTPMDFYTRVLGLDDDEAQAVLENVADVGEEDQLTIEPPAEPPQFPPDMEGGFDEDGNPLPPKPPGQAPPFGKGPNPPPGGPQAPPNPFKPAKGADKGKPPAGATKGKDEPEDKGGKPAGKNPFVKKKAGDGKADDENGNADGKEGDENGKKNPFAKKKPDENGKKKGKTTKNSEADSTENEQPRDADGRFGSGGGGGGSSDLEVPPNGDYKLDESKLKSERGARKEFERAIREQYGDRPPLFHEAPLSALDGIIEHGLTSSESAEGVNFATVGKPSGFITSDDKVIVKFSPRGDRPKEKAKIHADMRYDPESPHADLLREHKGISGADVAYDGNVLVGNIDRIYVVRGGKVAQELRYPFKTTENIEGTRDETGKYIKRGMAAFGDGSDWNEAHDEITARFEQLAQSRGGDLSALASAQGFESSKELTYTAASAKMFGFGTLSDASKARKIPIGSKLAESFGTDHQSIKEWVRSDSGVGRIPLTTEEDEDDDWEAEYEENRTYKRDSQGRFGSGGGGGGGGAAFKPGEYDRDTWEDLPVAERDRLADAANSVPAQMNKHLGDLPKAPNTGDVKKDIGGRLDQMSDRVHPEARQKIAEATKKYDDVLKEAGVDDASRRELSLDAVDAIAAQEMEACSRQLGDHGAAHITGNINEAYAILDEVPGTGSPQDRAIAATAMIHHDAGYLTPPSQNFLDEGHPRWSGDHYRENVRPKVEKALGPAAADDVAHIIRTHDMKDIDWKNDPVASACRVSDNAALFSKEKAPPLLRYAPDNVDVLESLGRKEISLADAKKQMRANVDKADVPEKMRPLLHRGVDEVSDRSPKFTVGMYGGEVTGVEWSGDHLKINLKENKANTRLNKLGDFGQRQFGKFAETYGVDPAEFQSKKKFTFSSTEGSPLLEGVWNLRAGEIEILAENKTYKRDSRGRFGSGGGGGGAAKADDDDSSGVVPARPEWNRHLDKKETGHLHKLWKERTGLNKKLKDGSATTKEKDRHAEVDAKINGLRDTAKKRIARGDEPFSEPKKKTDKKTTKKKGKKKSKPVDPDDPGLSRYEMKQRLRELPNYKKEDKVRAMVEESPTYRKDHVEVTRHGMTNKEMISRVTVDGTEIAWTAGTEQSAMRSIVQLSESPDIPPALWKNTKSLTHTEQKNKEDPKWAVKYHDPHFKSHATGGALDGSVVVYRDASIGVSSFNHEAGHNLARRVYYDTDPSLHTSSPGGKAYAEAQKTESPVSSYGANSSGEDFAEAMSHYNNPDKHLRMRRKFPEKYAATRQILNEYK